MMGMGQARGGRHGADHAIGAALLLLLASGACGDDAPPGGGGGGPAPEPRRLTVEVLDVGLDGRREGWSADRVTALAAELERAPDDVACLTGAFGEQREQLAAALRGAYPHQLALPTGDDSPVEPLPGWDAAPQDEGACAGLKRYPMRLLLGCIAALCGEEEAGRAPEDPPLTRLAEAACTEPGGTCVDWLAVVDEIDPSGRCGSCVLSHVRAGVDLATADLRCVIRPGALPHDGDLGLLLLSRHPIQEVDVRVLPSTWGRRGYLRARVATPATPLQVMCASLTPAEAPGLRGEWPRGRPHVEGVAGGIDGWAEENAAQVEGLLAAAAAAPADAPLVVLGNLGNSPATTRLDGFGTRAVERLSMALPLAAPAGHDPSCTTCPDNPLVARWAPASWMNRVHARGLPGDATVTVVRTATGRTVQIDDPSRSRPFSHVPPAPQHGTRVELAWPALP